MGVHGASGRQRLVSSLRRNAAHAPIADVIVNSVHSPQDAPSVESWLGAYRAPAFRAANRSVRFASNPTNSTSRRSSPAALIVATTWGSPQLAQQLAHLSTRRIITAGWDGADHRSSSGSPLAPRSLAACRRTGRQRPQRQPASGQWSSRAYREGSSSDHNRCMSAGALEMDELLDQVLEERGAPSRSKNCASEDETAIDIAEPVV